MWKRRFTRKTGPTRGFRRSPRKGRPAEVSNMTYVGTVTAEAGLATYVAPATSVVQVASLSGLVTDFQVADQEDPSRSIPPQYKGLSVVGGSIRSRIAITKCPTSDFIDSFHASAEPPYLWQSWAGGYVHVYEMFYIDGFNWEDIGGGVYAEAPNFDVVHPWNADLIPGAVHTEFHRPKRVVYRTHHVLDAAVCCIGGSGTMPIQRIPGGHMVCGSNVRLRKIFLDERSSLWYACCVTNPWAAGTGGNDRNIELGITLAGPLAYKLRTS